MKSKVSLIMHGARSFTLSRINRSVPCLREEKANKSQLPRATKRFPDRRGPLHLPFPAQTRAGLSLMQEPDTTEYQCVQRTNFEQRS